MLRVPGKGVSSGMTEITESGAEPLVFNQRFAVDYHYPVYFTRNLFSPGNPIVAETVARYEPTRRHRLVAFVDEAVAQARPSLLADITAYVARHPARLELLAPPETIPGGETAKNTPALIEQLQRRLRELGI